MPVIKFIKKKVKESKKIITTIAENNK